MTKNFLIAAVIVIATPSFLFSQELFFWSFDNDAITKNATAQPGTSGTAYLFANQAIAFINGVDIDFTSSDSSVLLLTGGTAINDPFPTLGGGFAPRFDTSVVTIGAASAGSIGTGNWTAGPSLNPANSDESLVDPNFVPDVGHLVAQVDYDIVGEGASTLDMTLGGAGILTDPTVLLNVTFGSATISVSAVPEPSSAMLFVLGSLGLVARRRRA